MRTKLNIITMMATMDGCCFYDDDDDDDGDVAEWFRLRIEGKGNPNFTGVR